MNREHYVKRRKHPAYLAQVAERKRRGPSGCGNPCFRPSAGASKADLREFHQEDLRLRRSKQLVRTANRAHPRSGSIATDNRHGGEHKHEREIARRGEQ